MAKPNLKEMTKLEKLQYFSGGRVTVGRITQVFDNTLKVSWVAKVRGVVVGNKDECLHETPEAARAYGQEVLAKWKELAKGDTN